MEVYYFSGTGNSAAIAKKIADRCGGKLIPIASVIDNEVITIETQVLGIVYPVYNHGIPYIIKRFVNKLQNLQHKYIFAVCTYGDSPCLSLENLQQALKDNQGDLAAGFALKMPYNYISPTFVLKNFLVSFTLREISLEKQKQLFSVSNQKLESIFTVIENRQHRKPEIQMKAIEHLIDYLNLRETLQKKMWLKIAGFNRQTELPYLESIQLMDHGFNCEDTCISCNTCVEICPVKNIELINGKPVWQHHCEQCFACLQWCPKQAIQFGSNTSKKQRYHHPDIQLKDMLICKMNK